MTENVAGKHNGKEVAAAAKLKGYNVLCFALLTPLSWGELKGHLSSYYAHSPC